LLIVIRRTRIAYERTEKTSSYEHVEERQDRLQQPIASYPLSHKKSIKGRRLFTGEQCHGDGRIIRSQCAILPNGGRMLTYNDVTDLVAKANQFEHLATIVVISTSWLMPNGSGFNATFGRFH
jgi:hypothetical protein